MIDLVKGQFLRDSYRNFESDDLELPKVGHRNKDNTFACAII